MALKLRPWWQRPFIRLANWWQYGHTEASFGNHSIPAYGPPRDASGRPIGSPIYRLSDEACSRPTTGNAGVE
jgi:hypothetical protein